MSWATPHFSAYNGCSIICGGYLALYPIYIYFQIGKANHTYMQTKTSAQFFTQNTYRYATNQPNKVTTIDKLYQDR
jgi:hypothetical protein